MEYKLVIVVRKDLGLSPGKMAVQVAHAAVMCAFETKKRNPRWLKAWMDEGQRKVVVKVQSEDELHTLREKARKEGLVAMLVVDAGLTEVPPGTVTCLGIGPGPEKIVDRVTGHLPLL